MANAVNLALRPSRIEAALQWVAHMGAFVCIVALAWTLRGTNVTEVTEVTESQAWQGSWGMALAWLVVALFGIGFSYVIVNSRQKRDQKDPRRCTALVGLPDGTLVLRLADGTEQHARVAPNAFVAPWLIVLVVAMGSSGGSGGSAQQTQRLRLWPDSLAAAESAQLATADERRALRLWLKVVSQRGASSSLQA